MENKSGATYKNAVLKLIAGDVRRVHENQPYPVYAQYYKASDGRENASQVSEKSFFEYHLYKVERPTDIKNNETKQISLFETSNIPVEKKYYYRAYGSNVESGKALVVVQFENKEKNGLGIPLPKGKVRVYKNDGENVEFIGEDWIDHTPKNDELKLKIGQAFDIRIKETQTENRRIADKTYKVAYKITVLNSKEEDIVLNVEAQLPRNWDELESSLEYEKKNSNTVVFKVPVKAGSKDSFTYEYIYSY